MEAEEQWRGKYAHNPTGQGHPCPLSIESPVRKPKGWPQELCNKSAFHFGMSSISHVSSMNQIHMGATSAPNLLSSNSPHNIPASCNFMELNLIAQNNNHLHSSSIVIIN